MHAREIHEAVRLVRKAIRRWPEPIVGVVAKESRNPFKILVSCILSLRTKDQTTTDASRRLFAEADDPTAMLRIPPHRLEQLIYPVGFYRNKAKHIRTICQMLLSNYQSKVPNSIEELIKLPGVGRKTANLVMTLGYRKPGICVDIHVHRICNRWGYVATKTPEKTESALRAKLPRRYWITFNDLLVPFGQNLCRPVSPYCSRCPVTQYCDRVGVLRAR